MENTFKEFLINDRALATVFNSKVVIPGNELIAEHNLHGNRLASLEGVKTATITASWTGSVPPYTQTVLVTGVTANDEPVISPVYSATLATARLQKESWNMISDIKTGTGIITITCFDDKPVTAIPIQLKGV